jgi:hypothetical protein
MRTLTIRIAAAAFALSALAGPAAGQVAITALNCSAAPNGHIAWPATDPLWEMDVVRPSMSSGVDGSGLEIRDVRYRGRLVMKRGHAPILNVEYDPGGGCGCFRDWSDSETGYCVNGLSPGPTGTCAAGGPTGCVVSTDPGDVATTCDRNMAGGAGGNVGSFTGIAAEDFGTELVLTTHMSAGWYRYRVKWHFYEDGRIWPEYSFSAASATCTSANHRHHAYWRFDFDIDGNGTTDTNDAVTEVNSLTSSSTTFTTEESRTWGAPSSGIYWQIRDATTSAGYDIIPSSADLLLPVDAFSRVDAMVVRYVAGNYDDGSPSCAINPSVTQLDNNESLANQDVVFWYRSSALHTGNNPWECDIVGPSLIPEGFDPTAAEGGPDAPESGLVLESARPNPFNPTTSIRFRVAAQQYVTIRMFDVTGREVAVLFDGWARENREEIVRIDGAGLPSGNYVVRLEGESVSGTTRVTLAR